MPQLHFGEQTLTANEGESVLDCMLRSGVQVSSSCRAGACQSCLMQATSGEIPESGQRGLKDTQRARGFFLSCITRPTTDLTLSLADVQGEQLSAEVVEQKFLSASVLRLRLAPERPFSYRAGQFVNLVREDGLTRSYSLASVPEEDSFLELHVRMVAGGQMTSWLRTVAPGQRVQLRGPSGECFYVAGRPEQPMLLVGAGTGLAPLYGIARDAIRSGHTGPVTLLHGAREPSGLYLVEELQELGRRRANLTYSPCVLQDSEAGEGGSRPWEVAPLGALLASRFAKLGGWRVFLCGDAELVTAMRRQVFLSGASRRDIAADAFLMAPRPAA